MRILLKNGNLIDTKAKINEICDILIEDGKVAKIIKANNANPDNVDTVIDCKGKYVFPGFIDAHCHLREPGFEYKEDIYTGSRSAAKGGFTSIACMPNTNPAIDNASMVEYIITSAKERGLVNVFPIGAVSKGQQGKELAEIGDMKSMGAVAVSDDGNPVKSPDLMKKALQYSAMFDISVISHCEDMDLAEEGVMNEGYNSTVLGLKGIPSIAEDIMVARDVMLSEYLGVPIHIAHVSTKGAVEIVRQAKKRGVKVTCETCPHYFSLTDDECIGFNTLAKVNPPLRVNEDVEAVVAGLKDGTIDMIATDHAPHHPDEKNVEFNLAAKGMVGFETAFALAYTKLVKSGELSIEELVEKMTTNPAKLLRINKGSLEIGADADIVVASVEDEYEIKIDRFASKSKNSPFDGKKVFGKVIHTLVSGNVVVKDGELV